MEETSYNESGAYFATSSKEIIEEKEIWEKIVPHSILLVQKLDMVELDNYFLAKYINVLFGMRRFGESFNKYTDFVYVSRTNKRIDNFRFHDIFIDFMSRADSVLDYLDKLFKDLKKLNPYLNFNRKNDYIEKFSSELSSISVTAAA